MHSRILSRLNNKGELLVETLASILIFTLASILFFSMVTAASNLNEEARAVRDELDRQLEVAESGAVVSGGSGVSKESEAVFHVFCNAEIDVSPQRVIYYTSQTEGEDPPLYSYFYKP